MPGHRAQKRFGQNFLVSPTIITRIVELVGLTPNDTVVEIGPGQGALTVPLAETGARVVAVEFDRDLIAGLSENLRQYEQVTVLNQDFLKFEPTAHGLEKFVLVGNLPYNLSSPVIEWTTRHAEQVERAVFMLQKEVAERLCSSPGGKDWSPLAIFTQLVFEAQRRFDVSPEHFRPRPKVTSSVVELIPKADRITEFPPMFETVVRSAFHQRRKQLVNNLVPEVMPTAAEAREVIGACGLEPNVRAEQLSIEDFFRLTRMVMTRSIPQQDKNDG